MNDFLSKNKIDYVIYHLIHSLKLSEAIKSYFFYNLIPNSYCNHTNKIIFDLSSKTFELDKVKWINNIPVLYPISEKNSFYSIEKNNLVFHHDILKSAFYLLSGYQELNPEYTDKFNRFPYDLSIQKKLGITKKPIVNYYFEIIKQGIKEFCEINSIENHIIEKEPSFKFFLSHDIDVVDTYNINDLIYYLKVFLGITKSSLSFKLRFKKLIEYLFNFLFTRKNPNWDFEFLRQIEKKYNIRSAFYFLPQGVKHQDAYYSFSESRLVNLFKKLKKDNCEVGIHGSIKSSTNFDVLESNISDLEKYSNQKIVGMRQHRLLYDMNITPKIHEKSNLLYDTTLGFAEHEGFRNSYCHPFKLYNFQEDRPYNTWEIPLNVMDATLFKYRELNRNQAMDSVKEIIKEIKEFNGIFTLLWHNGNFNEVSNPGIKTFYIQLLEYIYKSNAISVLGNDINKYLNND